MSPHDTPGQNGNGRFPDLAALTARLADFDRRIGETRQRTELLDQKTAAYIVGRAEALEGGAIAVRPASSAPARSGALTVSTAAQ